MINKLIPKCRIRIRMLLVLVGLTVASMVGFAVVSVLQMRSLGEDAIKENVGLGEDAVRISKVALGALVQDGLLHLAEDQAFLIDREFEKMSDEVDLAGEYLKLLWENPDTIPPRRSYTGGDTVPPNELEFYSFYQIAPGVPPDSVKNEMDITSNMDPMLREVKSNESHIDFVEFGMPSGFFRRYPWPDAVRQGYDPRTRPWYKDAVRSGKRGWTENYCSGGDLMINGYNPIYDDNHALIAVIGATVRLDTISDKLIKTKLNNLGKAILVDHDMKIMVGEDVYASGDKCDENTKPVYFEFKAEDKEKEQFLKDIAEQKSGVLRDEYKGTQNIIAYAPITRPGWYLLFVVPMEEVVAPLAKTESRIIRQTDVTRKQIQERIKKTLLILCGVFVVIMIGVIVESGVSANRFSAPIIELDAGAKIIGDGNLDHRLEIHTGDEIEDLAESFNKMASNLKVYIKDLQETTAVKERIQSELNVATEIQASLLPRVFPAFPDRPEFDIFASMDPAKEVGGDFYDFFFVDDSHLFFLVADVSDKGVPAALYMMVAKTMIKTEALRGLPPDEVLRRVNDQLSPDNEKCMFVTVLCCILDTRTGEMTLSNAGHNPPVVWRSGEEPAFFELPKGFVIGPMPDQTYLTNKLTLKKDDIFYMYTDGVTEAKNPESKLFGNDRLQKIMARQDSRDVTKIIKNIGVEVEVYSDTMPQADDITMVAIKFNGAKS